MQVGDEVALYIDNQFVRFERIIETDVPSGLGLGMCYKVESGSLFFMKPELCTLKHYNVGNNRCWIRESNYPNDWGEE